MLGHTRKNLVEHQIIKMIRKFRFQFFYGYASRNHNKSDENKPKNRLQLYFSAFQLHMIIHMSLYSCINILLHIVCYSAFFKNLRFCSAKFGNSKSVWAHVTD